MHHKSESDVNPRSAQGAGIRPELGLGPSPGPGLIDVPPGLPALAVSLVAVKLTRKPTAYANQRMLRIP